MDNKKKMPHCPLMDAFFQFKNINFSSIMPDQLVQSDCRVLGALGKLTEEKEDVGVTVSELGKRVKVSAPSMSRTLNHLEKKGYVNRYQSVEDRRNTYVRLTKKAYQSLEEVNQMVTGLNQAILNRIGEDRVQECMKFLNDTYEVTKDEINKIKQEQEKRKYKE